MAIVGSDERNTEIFLQTQQIRANLPFERKPLVLNLKEKVGLTEDVPVSTGAVARRIVLASHEVLA